MKIKSIFIHKLWYNIWMENQLTHENKKALCQLMKDESLIHVFDVLSEEEKSFILEKAQKNYKYHKILSDLSRFDLFTYKSLYGFIANDKIPYNSKITAIRNDHCRSLMTPELLFLYFKVKDHFLYFRNEEDEFCYFILQYFDGMNVNYDLLNKDKLSYILETHPRKDEILLFLLKNNTITNHLTISSYQMLLDVIEKAKGLSNKIGNFTINSTFLCNCFSEFDDDQQYSLISFLVKNDQLNKIEDVLKELTCKNSLNNNLRGIKRKILNGLILNLKKAIKEVNHKPNYITIFFSDEPKHVIDSKIKYFLIDKNFDRLELMNFFAMFLSKNNEYLFSWLYQLHCYSVINKYQDNETVISDHISSDLSSRLNNDIWIYLINRDYRFWAITPKHFRNKIRKNVKLKASKILQQKRFFGISEEDVDDKMIFELCEVEISNVILYSEEQFEKNKEKLREIAKNIYSNHNNVEFKNKYLNQNEIKNKLVAIMTKDEIYEYCIQKRVSIGYFIENINESEELCDKYQYDILEEIYDFHFGKNNIVSKRLKNKRSIIVIKDKMLVKNKYELSSLGELVSSFDIKILNNFFQSKVSINESHAQIWHKMFEKHPHLLIGYPQYKMFESLKDKKNLLDIVSMYISQYQTCEFVWHNCNFYEKRNLILKNLYRVLEQQVFGSINLHEFEHYFLNKNYLAELLPFLADPLWTPDFLNKAYSLCLEEDLSDEQAAIEKNPLFSSVDMAIYLMEKESE